MVRGEVNKPKVHYKGKNDDFVVFVDDTERTENWKADQTIPLAQVVSSFKIFVTNRHGTEGGFDGASNAALKDEFGTSDEDAVIKQIIQKGTLQKHDFPERTGSKNDSIGSRGGH
ncbi:shwachman-Bodian-diamond syndrome protein [Xylogone sp. PMI_703]|nr:shwachman-Bodian-diamond syndrome protein [Xylogone sp. PMI_703]